MNMGSEVFVWLTDDKGPENPKEGWTQKEVMEGLLSYTSIA